LKSYESEEKCDFGGFLKSRLCLRYLARKTHASGSRAADTYDD